MSKYRVKVETREDVIRDAVRGLCGLPSAEIAWRVVDALEMAGYRIVPLRERTLTACDICGRGYPPGEMVRGKSWTVTYCVECAATKIDQLDRLLERIASERDALKLRGRAADE